MPTIDRILVPVDFSPASDAALDFALRLADESGAEVEVLHVWSPRDTETGVATEIFADTPEGVAMEQRLSAAETAHAARVSGRLEFGKEASDVILAILEHEPFDLVVMGEAGGRRRETHESGEHRIATAARGAEGTGGKGDGGEGDSDHAPGHVVANVAKGAPCKVITRPPPPLAPDGPDEPETDETVAA